MKKINYAWYLSLLLITILGCVGCQKKRVERAHRELDSWMLPSDKMKVLSTTKMIDDLVEEIGGDYIIHLSLITGQLDPHSYELVKGDDEKLTFADAVFYNGLDLEHGRSLKTRLIEHKHGVSLGDALAKEPGVSFLIINGQVDPHIWMDVRLFSQCIDPIVKKLSELDPQHQADFEKNGKSLKGKMIHIDEEIREKIQGIPKENRFLVSTHDAFFYFSRSYLCDDDEKGQFHERFAAPEGLAPDVQMSSEDLKQIIAYIKANNISTIFPESNLSQDALRKIVNVLNSQGVKVHIAKEVLYADAMGEKGSGADHYLKMIQHDADVIVHYLNLKEEEHGQSL